MQVISDSEYLQDLINQNVKRSGNCEELRHFLEFEIQRTVEWMEDKENPAYDGVDVGRNEAQLLRERHIKFCERLLKMI